MNNSLRALSEKRSTLESLKIQGQAILHRGNVSMEECDSFIHVANAVLAGDKPAEISSTIAIDNTDPDAKLELGVMEIDQQLDATNTALAEADTGPVPPSDAIVSMSEDEVQDMDTLLDEAEELDALAEVGYAMQEDSGLDESVAVESYKPLVTSVFKRLDISLEDIAQAKTLSPLISAVTNVRDVADNVINEFSQAKPEASTEGIAETFAEIYGGALYRIMERARFHAAMVVARKKGDSHVPA